MLLKVDRARVQTECRDGPSACRMLFNACRQVVNTPGHLAAMSGSERYRSRGIRIIALWHTFLSVKLDARCRHERHRFTSCTSCTRHRPILASPVEGVG